MHARYVWLSVCRTSYTLLHATLPAACYIELSTLHATCVRESASLMKLPASVKLLRSLVGTYPAGTRFKWH